MSKEQCFLCDSVVNYMEIAWIFIPGEKIHWPEFNSGGIYVPAGVATNHAGPFKLCEICQKAKGRADLIKKKIPSKSI